jgi:hypothetical protein
MILFDTDTDTDSDPDFNDWLEAHPPFSLIILSKIGLSSAGSRSMHSPMNTFTRWWQLPADSERW